MEFWIFYKTTILSNLNFDKRSNQNTRENVEQSLASLIVYYNFYTVYRKNPWHRFQEEVRNIKNY